MSEPADADVVASWDAVSAAYQARYQIPATTINLGPMVPTMAELGIDLDVAGQRVLDFGCGGGQNAVACSIAGAAAVIGMDPSERQLAVARSLARRAGVVAEFRDLNDAGLADLAGTFDIVLSVYAMQFVADIYAALGRIAALMRPGGTLVLSVDHPVRLSGEWRDHEFVIEGYFVGGWQSWPYDFPEAGLQVTMRRFRRTTAEWVNAVLAAPFTLRGLYEPLPPEVPDSFGRKSKYGIDDPRNVFSRERLQRVPGTLILVAERAL
jgi:2-polyprenyl-3-methyl-5-hydroxy-6-metoxy-1,4-benzoquinol methylase